MEFKGGTTNDSETFHSRGMMESLMYLTNKIIIMVIAATRLHENPVLS